MFAPTRGFLGMADSMEPCKMFGAHPCCHGNDIWHKGGDPVAYRIVCLSVTFYVVAKRHILAKNWPKEQIGVPPETTLRYQFGSPFLP